MSLSLHYFAHCCSLTRLNTYLCSSNQSILRKHRMLIGVTHIKKAPGHMQFNIYTGFFIRIFLRAFRVHKYIEISEGGYNLQHFKLN